MPSAVDLESALARQAELQAELEEIAVIIRYLRRKDSNGHSGSPAPLIPVAAPAVLSATGYKRKRIWEAAQLILAEWPDHTGHFEEVADEAVKRGFKGRKNSTDQKIIRQSFWSIMRRYSDMFEFIGAGRFRLKESDKQE